MAVAQGYGKTVTSGSVFAYDTGDTRNSYKGEPTTNVATGTLTPYTPYNTMTRSGQNLTITMVGGSALYLTFHNGTDYNGQTITLSGYMFKNGTPHTLPNNRANTYHTVAASKWYFDSVTGYFEIVEVCNASSIWLFHTPSGASGGDVITILDFQVEVKTHATPFVNGTRSATQGLLPLVGNSTIDLSNVSFDSNAQMTFDGTDDYTVIGTVGITDYSQPFTMECIFKVDSAATWDNGFLSNIYGIAGSYAGMYGLFKNSNNAVGLQLRDATTTSYATATGLSKGSYYHLVGTWNGSNTMVLYVNGVVTQTTSTTKTGATDSSNLYIGGVRAYGGAAGNYYQGEIPIVKYYNRALTAAEINQNYLHYKTRFNLS
jgi:hypothetical protein